MEGNSVFHPFDKAVFVFKSDATFIKKVGTKNDIVMKTCGVNK